MNAINKTTDNLVKLMHGENIVGECETRYPDEWHQKEYLIQHLRAICMHREGLQDSLSTQRFRSIRGQIRHGHFDNAFNFFKKHGGSHIREEFEKYCNSKCIVNISIPVTFSEPVTVYTIELKSSNEEETNDGQKT